VCHYPQDAPLGRSKADRPLPHLEDFGQLMESLTFCILIHHAVSKDILWANQAACDMLGFSLSELKPLKAPDMSGSGPEFQRSTACGLKKTSRAVQLFFRAAPGLARIVQPLRTGLGAGVSVIASRRPAAVPFQAAYYCPRCPRAGIAEVARTYGMSPPR
jgi:PAS domain-containing protein